MLDVEVKKTIQSAYRQLLDSLSLVPRYGQRQMIAEIANSLAHSSSAEDELSPICVVEAGTGTGKTLAYVLAVVVLAKALQKKVVIATATVALQEQIVGKDLPEILNGSDLDFSFSLAKGRGRYLCLARLDMMLQGNDSLQAMFDLYGEELENPDGGDQALYQRMLDELGNGKWQGDRDDWREPIPEPSWRAVTVNNSQCMGSRCSHFSSCCFYKARESMAKADCIVTNHDLVLSDLALGGGVILPDPANTIYVFDEAHNLPLKSNNHFATFTRLRSSITWLQGLYNIIEQLSREDVIDEQKMQVLANEITPELDETLKDLERAWLLLEQISDSLQHATGTQTSNNDQPAYEGRDQYAFSMGVVPVELQTQAEVLATRYSRLANSFEEIADRLKTVMEDGDDFKRRQRAEQWFPLIGSQNRRIEGNLALWLSFAHQDKEGEAPHARWLTINEYNDSVDISLSSSPVLAARNLQDKLWEICSAAVLTSATLSALGRFDMLKMRAGLPEHTQYHRIASPFDYRASARLVIPRINCEPSNTQAHTAALIKGIPKILQPSDAALVLFSSRRQMLDVLQGLPKEWVDRILCQDDYQKSQLLKYHRQQVDQGSGSVIFGLSSFAEGVDLPGKYCTHVIIAKIPFAVPNDPIESTLAQWMEAQGRNPFMTLSVPDAAFRLVQASGRLLRNENDSGQITLFDERIVSKRYGQSILESLPPYTREIFQTDLAN